MKPSHSVLCLYALIDCCIRTAEAKTSAELERVNLETLCWRNARKALSN